MKSLLALMTLLVAADGALAAPSYQEPPFLADAVKKGDLPAIGDRLPEHPAVAEFQWPGQTPGQYGGEMTTLFSSAKDIKYMVTYGYAELVVYDSHYRLVPNVLESFDVDQGRLFPLHLRKGLNRSHGPPI